MRMREKRVVDVPGLINKVVLLKLLSQCCRCSCLVVGEGSS